MVVARNARVLMLPVAHIHVEICKYNLNLSISILHKYKIKKKTRTKLSLYNIKLLLEYNILNFNKCCAYTEASKI